MDFQCFVSSLKLEKNLSPTTIRAYANDLDIFSRFAEGVGKSTVANIDRAAIVEFIEYMKQSTAGRLDQLGLSDATIARRLTAISGFLDYTRATTLPELRNPIKEMKRIKRKSKYKRKLVKAVDEDVLDRLLSGITVLRDRILFALYLATGLRLSELQQLDRGSIALELRVNDKGREYVTGSGQVIGKGDKERFFYVDKETVPLYAQYLDTRKDDSPALFLSERKQRMSPRAIQYTLSEWCRKLNLPHIHPHQLRHSYATRLANADIDHLQLKDLMGHSDFQTTLGYFKINEEKIAQGYFAAMEIYRPTSH